MVHPALALRAALTVELDQLRPEGVDMSPQAITHRLKELAEMSSLCLELARLGERAVTP